MCVCVCSGMIPTFAVTKKWVDSTHGPHRKYGIECRISVLSWLVKSLVSQYSERQLYHYLLIT